MPDPNYNPNAQTSAPYFTGTPSTQTAGGSTSSTTASGPGSAYYWLSLALQGASSYANYSSARQANRQNVALQRDQLDWEERMANTAVQRRAADIEAAGGNRALAFTNGSEASTPTVAPAHVEPAQLQPLNLLSAKLAEQQYRQGEANIALTRAQSQKTQVEADVASGSSQSALDRANTENIQAQDWARIKTALLKTQDLTTAKEYEKLSKTIDSMINIAQNESMSSEIKLKALQAIDNFGGVEGNLLAPLIKLLIGFVK